VDAVDVLDDILERVELTVFKASVPEILGLELKVFEVVTLLVDVVEEEGVLLDKEHLEAVDELLVVLEVVPVAVLVSVLTLVSVPFGLADSLGEPVDVLEGPIERV